MKKPISRICLGLILVMIMSTVISASVFASDLNAPPSIPAEYWGRLMIDGEPAPDGTEVKYFNGEEWIITTTVDGWYNLILTGGDSDLTDPDDPDCSLHWAENEACIPCEEGDCVEGPKEGDTVDIIVNDTPVSITWGEDANSEENVLVKYRFVQGWNMFSLPVLPSNTNIEYLLSNIEGDYSAVWTTTSTGAWKSSAQPFSPLTDLQLEKSYYIYVTSEDPIEFAVQGVPQKKTTTIKILPGWNLIGYPLLESDTIDNILVGTDYNVVWTSLSNGAWKSSVQPFAPLTHFNPGGGYLLYTDSEGSYDIVS
ncbi:hypothetical protein KY366_04200 [Candidatus Woesearchaeota archaeon]|nr:hypothetical protein [Candidatus Woesearchaeota archaeon]